MIYLFCGLSDFADGFIARKFHLVSHLGQILDSFADVFFLVVVAILLLPFMAFPRWLAVWTFILFAIKATAFFIVLERFRNPLFLHTISNKLTGVLLFCIPLALQIIDFEICAMIISFGASVAAIEDLFIAEFSTKIAPDIKSAALICKRAARK
jgi:CDP-alcohol phosphatidyltransferase.